MFLLYHSDSTPPVTVELLEVLPGGGVRVKLAEPLGPELPIGREFVAEENRLSVPFRQRRAVPTE